jgi:hypothetical protein
VTVALISLTLALYMFLTGSVSAQQPASARTDTSSRRTTNHRMVKVLESFRGAPVRPADPPRVAPAANSPQVADVTAATPAHEARESLRPVAVYLAEEATSDPAPTSADAPEAIPDTQRGKRRFRLRSPRLHFRQCPKCEKWRQIGPAT